MDGVLNLKIAEVTAEDGCHNPVEEDVNFVTETNEFSEICASPEEPCIEA